MILPLHETQYMQAQLYYNAIRIPIMWVWYMCKIKALLFQFSLIAMHFHTLVGHFDFLSSKGVIYSNLQCNMPLWNSQIYSNVLTVKNNAIAAPHIFPVRIKNPIIPEIKPETKWVFHCTNYTIIYYWVLPSILLLARHTSMQ